MFNIDCVEEFLVSNNQVMLITGATQTGKTTIGANIKKQLKGNAIFLIPTNRLKFQMENWESLEVSSLYSFLYQERSIKEETIIEAAAEEENLIKNFEVKENEDSNQMVYILDQGSFVIDKEVIFDDNVQFGSNNLFEDLLSYLDLDNSQRKLIVIGDPYLLINFGKFDDSAVNKIKLAQKTDRPIVHLELKNPLSSTVHEAHQIAKSIENKLFNELVLSSISLDKSKLKRENIYLKNDLKILHFSNEEVTKSNDYYHNSPKLIRIGDRLSIFNNFEVANDEVNENTCSQESLSIITNGDELIVNEVLGTMNYDVVLNKMLTTITIQRLKISHIRLNRSFVIPILANYFLNTDSFLEANEQIALRILKTKELSRIIKKEFIFQETNDSVKLDTEILKLETELSAGMKVKTKLAHAQKLRKSLLTKQKKSFRKNLIERLRLNPNSFYFQLENLAFVKLGWATTVHKANGQKWGEIYLDYSSFSQGKLNENFFRWIYTALTTTKGNISILNYDEGISPLMEAIITKEVIPEKKQSKISEEIIFESIEATEDSAIVGFVQYISNTLSLNGIKVLDYKLKQYQVIIQVENEEEIFVLAFSYNGKKQFKRNGNQPKSPYESTRENCFRILLNNKHEKLQLAQAPKMKWIVSLTNSIQDKLKVLDMTLENIEYKQYMFILSISHHLQVVFNYKGTGIISHILVRGSNIKNVEAIYGLLNKMKSEGTLCHRK